MKKAMMLAAVLVAMSVGSVGAGNTENGKSLEAVAADLAADSAANTGVADETSVGNVEVETNTGVSAVGSKWQERVKAAEAKKAEVQAKMEERKAQAEEKKAELEAKRDEMVEQRCEVLEKRFETRIARYENNQAGVERLRERVVALVEKVIEKAKEEGLETAAVERALEEFKALIAEAEAVYAEHISELSQTQEYACGESEGQFKSRLEEARATLKEVRDAVLAARSYYQTELKPALQALRSQAQVKGYIDEAN